MSSPVPSAEKNARRFQVIWLAPFLALVALASWALASPLGAGPDDDYHLISAWCAGPTNSECTPLEGSSGAMVPEALVESECFKHLPDQSADCQLDFGSGSTVASQRGNFIGAYPPVFYTAMSVFAGEDLVVSALAMRIVNILLFVGVTTALFALLPPPRRPALLWSWLVSIVPLGLFILASNNPSSWAILGVGSAWISLLGWYETSGVRRWLLGAVFVLTAIMAGGARADAAIFVVVGILAAMVLAFRATKGFWLDSVLPIVIAATSVVLFFSARQSNSAISGFSSDIVSTEVVKSSAEIAEIAANQTARDSFFALWQNFLNLPSLLSGSFGSWGLGWIDTSLPSIVLYASIAAFIAVVFTGVGQMDWRKALALTGTFFGLLVVPLYVLAQSSSVVGEQVQPRYILPLIVVFAGIATMTTGRRQLHFSRTQRLLLAFALTIAGAVALHTNIRRYTTGLDVASLNLDAHVEWWWNVGPSPMTVFVVGSIAWAALVFVLVHNAAFGSDRVLGPPAAVNGSSKSTTKLHGDGL